MRIKVGPIAAEFRGTAEIDRDPKTHSGVIEGSGRDQRSSSATRGLIRFRLTRQAETETRVELDVGYRLTGPLAQFSRSDLVQAIASGIVGTFAENVDARLSGRAVGTSGELNAGIFFLMVRLRPRSTLFPYTTLFR